VGTRPEVHPLSSVLHLLVTLELCLDVLLELVGVKGKDFVKWVTLVLLTAHINLLTVLHFILFALTTFLFVFLFDSFTLFCGLIVGLVKLILKRILGLFFAIALRGVFVVR
jgi:hypothetical protein